MSESVILPIILGPTASGKTRLAALTASALRAEIISADSRQVYRGMDLGTGKDYDDYIVDGTAVPYHLIDIAEAGEAYNLFQFQNDFATAFSDIVTRGRQPLVCGGTGLYIESVIKNYRLHAVPEDAGFRARCERMDFDALVSELQTHKHLHNTTDIDSKKRLIRALEIARYEAEHGEDCRDLAAAYTPLVIGVDVSRDERRRRIETRFKARMAAGMTEEVEALLARGVPERTLVYYGLEYKFLTLYVTGKISRNDLEHDLLTAIFQFAKRQMTWFRGMKRRGIPIVWIDGELPMTDRVERVLEIIRAV